MTPVDTEHFTEHYKMIGEGIQAEARIVRNVRDAKAAATSSNRKILHQGGNHGFHRIWP
jgi:hypothetical protein